MALRKETLEKQEEAVNLALIASLIIGLLASLIGYDLYRDFILALLIGGFVFVIVFVILAMCLLPSRIVYEIIFGKWICKGEVEMKDLENLEIIKEICICSVCGRTITNKKEVVER